MLELGVDTKNPPEPFRKWVKLADGLQVKNGGWSGYSSDVGEPDLICSSCGEGFMQLWGIYIKGDDPFKDAKINWCQDCTIYFMEEGTIVTDGDSEPSGTTSRSEGG